MAEEPIRTDIAEAVTLDADNEPGSALAARREQVAADMMPPAKKAILAATERLLDEAKLHDLNVTQILAEAGVSRPTFYSYFASKKDVAAALYTRVVPVLGKTWRVLAERRPGKPVALAIPSGLAQLAGVWADHRAALVTATENRHVVPRIQAAHRGLVELATDHLARQVERDRITGLAAPGPPITPLVLSLIVATEQTYYHACLGGDPQLPGPHAAAVPLAAIWLGSLYKHPRR